MTTRSEGFVSTEFVAAAAFLLLPVALLVSLLPIWSEVRSSAVDAADQAARAAAIAVATGASPAGAAFPVAAGVLDAHDVALSGLDVTAGAERVEVAVTVEVPLLPLPWQRVPVTAYTARRHHPVDPYRARSGS